MFKKLKNLFARQEKKPYEYYFKILEYSNIVQYDTMGYPLRLCLVCRCDVITQEWIDSGDLEGDVECIWTPVSHKKAED